MRKTQSLSMPALIGRVHPKGARWKKSGRASGQRTCHRGSEAPISAQHRPRGASERVQSLGEEIANSVSHGAGFVAAAIAVPLLLLATIERNAAINIVGAVIFGAAMLLLYFSSALYHALPPGRAKRVFCKIDHGAIYLFIAGSYTPFALGALHGAWGWTLFGLVWGIAAAGIMLKTFDRLAHPMLSTGLYLVMGWLALVAIIPLTERVPVTGLALLFAGGVAYTAGVVFFAADSRWRYAHFVWHLFVLTGSICHFFAVLDYAA